MVCARHLAIIDKRYRPVILYPKRGSSDLFINLVTQCEKFGIGFIDQMPDVKDLNEKYHVIVDALFGFSFKPPIRPGFTDIVSRLSETITPVASIDIPSGWTVEDGDVNQIGLKPDLLISLTAPKKCSVYFKGTHHYLGGRFVPLGIQEKYSLNLPKYPDLDCCVKL